MVYCKYILSFLLIFFVVFSFFDYDVYASYESSYLPLYQYQWTLQQDYINLLYSRGKNDTTAFNNALAIYNLMGQYSNQFDAFRFWVRSGDPTDGNVIYWFLYTVDSNTSYYTYKPWNNFESVAVFSDPPSTTAISRVYPNKIDVWSSGLSVSDTLVVDFPVVCTQVINENWIQLFKDFGIVNTGSDSVISALENALQNQTNSINNSINNQGQNITNSIDNATNTITDDNVNVDTDLPTSDTNDITLDGFNSIFDTIKNAFTTQNSTDVVLPIPFTDKSITINYSNVFGNFSFGILSRIINAFWFFVVSLFIAKDIKDKINKIKSGNIEDVETSNIKGDLL